MATKVAGVKKFKDKAKELGENPNSSAKFSDISPISDEVEKIRQFLKDNFNYDLHGKPGD